MEKISVLMSTYREPLEWIEQSLNSIIKQTYTDIEYIIIVDDPMNSELISYLQKYNQNNPRIKLLINPQNMGLVKSLNRGLQYCSGEYIARMDADDISYPERLEKQLVYMQKYRYDIVGCDYEVFFQDTVIKTSNSPALHESCKKTLRYESCIAHPSWLVRAKVYDQLNGYREIDACEDLDFLQRAIIQGFTMGNCKEVLLKYRDNPNSISHMKTAKQRAIAKRLSKSYRNGTILSDSDYQQFLQSKSFEKSCQIETKILKNEGIIKASANSYSIWKRGIAYISLCTCMRYIIRKMNRRKVRKWKREENEN